jgi:hypothetical protein
MRMKHFRPYLAVLSALYVSVVAPAFAESSYGPVSLSAFGTLGGAWLSNEHVNYQQGSQRVGPGLTHDIDLGMDSRLGAQLNIAVTPTTLITAQTAVERLANNQFMPRLTQANIRQEINDALAVRIGRIQSPLFLASDYRLANFSNPWARTPGVLYNIYPMTHLDSGEFTYRLNSDVGQLSLNAGYGWLTYPFPPNSGNSGTADLDLNDVIYANLKLDNGPWRFKLSWLHARLSTHFQTLDQVINIVGFFDPVAADALNLDRRGIGMYTAGFTYDANDWLVMSEWGIALSDKANVLNDNHGGYLTVGYHLDRWTPQITIGYQASTDRRIRSTNPIIDPALAGLHRGQRTDYRTLALGLNYAATDSVIIRGQVDLIEPMGNSLGPYLKTDSHYQFNDPGIDTLISLSVDFVY